MLGGFGPLRAPAHAQVRLPSLARPLLARACTARSLGTRNFDGAANCASHNEEGLSFLARRGRELGFPLSLSERQMIAARADDVGDRDGQMSVADWERLVSHRWHAAQERLTLSEFMVEHHNRHFGQHLLQWTRRLGISFFALSASHTAGEAGMHVVGAVIVGSVASLGGGTVNQVMIGATPVGWMRDSRLLGLAIGASLLGFYAWPLVELWLQEPTASHEPDESRSILRLERAELVRYAIESVALGALAVVGAQEGIIRGFHPSVSATLGVTTAFGGVFRDLMCQRELKLGASSGCQSYAAASFLASSSYIILRQLHVWNCPGLSSKFIHGGLPLGLRIVLGASTAVAFRVYVWKRKPDELFSSMDASATANDALLRAAFGHQPNGGGS